MSLKSTLLYFLLGFFIHAASHAQSVGEPWPPQKFLAAFGTAHVEGMPKKVIYLKGKPDDYFMVISSKQVADQFGSEYTHFHAYGFKLHNGKLQESWHFKEFASSLYRPHLYMKESGMVDTDGNGVPEFIVAYFGSSDGLDAKALKIITYIDGVKHKATALYPAGNPDDQYHIVYDANWKLLSKSSQAYVQRLFKTLKPFDLYE